MNGAIESRVSLLFSVLLCASACGANAPTSGSTDTGDSTQVAGEGEARFTGTITNMHLGVPYDGVNTLTIGGKEVTFDSAGDQSGVRGTWGRLFGIEVPKNPGGDNFAGYNGSRAEVYCAVEMATGPNGEDVPQYTLYGHEKYFIRLVD